MADIKFSTHAVERYIELVRPTLDFESAWAEVQRILKLCAFTEEPPPWHHVPPWWAGEKPHLHRTLGYLTYGDLTFPLVGAGAGELLAVTCVPRGSMSSEARTRRRDMRRGRQAAAKRKRTGRRDERLARPGPGD